MLYCNHTQAAYSGEFVIVSLQSPSYKKFCTLPVVSNRVRAQSGYFAVADVPPSDSQACCLAPTFALRHTLAHDQSIRKY